MKTNKDGAGMESATWGASRTNASRGDVLLLTFKSAEQTVKWLNPSDRSAFCPLVSNSHWNSSVLYRSKRAWSWRRSLCYFPPACKLSFQNLLVGGVKILLGAKGVLRVHMCGFFLVQPDWNLRGAGFAFHKTSRCLTSVLQLKERNQQS